jgi:hypothetical protein
MGLTAYVMSNAQHGCLTMATFDEMMTKWSWKPIRDCPGRYKLPASTDLAPEDLVGPETEVKTFQVTAARDTVMVASLNDGGLISYKRADGSYLHTLNTAEGFKRKLRDLGIKL